MRNKFNCSAFRRTATVDSVLSENRKVQIWTWLSKHAVHRFRRDCRLDRSEAENACADIYAKLIAKEYAAAFPKGFPKNDASLGAYLSKAVHFECLHTAYRQKRFPILLLDEPLGCEDGEETVSRIDRLEDDGEKPDIEVLVERPLVARALKFACARRGFKKRTLNVAIRALLKDETVGELAWRLGIEANAVSQIKSRVMAVMRKDGAAVLAALENEAA